CEEAGHLTAWECWVGQCARTGKGAATECGPTPWCSPRVALLCNAQRGGPRMHIRPRRSVLYMPGANERALEKAKALPADSLILDLEDSVASEAKATARANVCDAVKAGGYGRRELVIRPNAIETPWGMDDLRAAMKVAPDAILVPKVSQPGDILTVAKVLADMGAPAKTRLWAMMETP